MRLEPRVLVIAGILAFARVSLPLGLPRWGRLLALVTMPAWLGPIVIRFRHTQSLSAEFALIPPDGSGLPTGVRGSFDVTRDARSSQGFAEVVEGLDVYVTKRANAPINVFIYGGAWRSGLAKDDAFPAELFVRAGAHFYLRDPCQRPPPPPRG